jgi:polysaccharide export outer membrane protein
MKRAIACTAGFLAFALSAAAGQALQERDAPYRLEYSDVVALTYRYTPEFSQDVTIGPDGRALVAGLGSVSALHLTLDEFKERLLALSSSRLVSPDLTLTLKTYVKPHVMVEGDVNTPGRVTLSGDMSALDAIALAGGFRESGAKNNILLLRDEPGRGNETHVINLASLIKERKLEEVPKLRPGDILYVSSTKFSKLQQLAHLGAFGAIYNPIP